MFSFKHRVTGPELNVVCQALTAITGTEFKESYSDRYDRARAAINSLHHDRTRQDFLKNFEELFYAYRQVCEVRLRKTLDNASLDQLVAGRDKMLRSIIECVERCDIVPVNYEVPATVTEIIKTRREGLSIDAEGEDAEGEDLVIEVANEYAPTPVIVRHMDNAEELLERFAEHREMMLKPSTKAYRTARFPLVVMTDPFLTTEDLAKLGFEAESMSIYQIFHEQRVLAVKRKERKRTTFADAKNVILHELELKAEKVKAKGKGLRELVPDTEAFWVKYDRNVAKYNKELASAQGDLVKANAGQDKLMKTIATQMKAMERLAAKLSKAGSNKNSPEYRTEIAKLKELSGRQHYWGREIGMAMVTVAKAQGKIQVAQKMAEDYYTLADLKAEEQKLKKSWARIKASIAVVEDDKLDDLSRDVWAKMEAQTYDEDADDEDDNQLVMALQEINAKELEKGNNKKWVLVTESPIGYKDTDYDYYWIMENKQYMRLLNGSTSRAARQTSYTKVTEWGFAF